MRLICLSACDSLGADFRPHQLQESAKTAQSVVFFSSFKLLFYRLKSGVFFSPPTTVAVAAQPRVQRPSDMNRCCNLLAFPHEDYLIREKREGWTTQRTMDPLRTAMRGKLWLKTEAKCKINKRKPTFLKGSIINLGEFVLF